MQSIILAIAALAVLGQTIHAVTTDKNAIVDLHNKYRSGVNPTASDMVKMYWDNELEAKAQSFINTCPMNHDSGDARKINGWGMNIGQNLAWGYPSWEVSIAGWYDEVKDFRMNQGSTNGRAVGHYTQVVQNKAARVGCAYKNCPGTKYTHYYVCNYAYGQGNFKTPYTQGSSCSKCSGRCSNKLCDCGGKICKNGGTLNVGTCNCECEALYKGSDCGQINCPATDPEVCGASWGYPKYRCTEWTNVPVECPRMCGLC